MTLQKSILKNRLMSQFKMMDIGESRFVLGMQTTRDRKFGWINTSEFKYWTRTKWITRYLKGTIQYKLESDCTKRSQMTLIGLVENYLCSLSTPRHSTKSTTSIDCLQLNYIGFSQMAIRLIENYLCGRIQALLLDWKGIPKKTFKRWGTTRINIRAYSIFHIHLEFDYWSSVYHFLHVCR